MVYQHRFSGSLAGGDTWMFTWWATSGSPIDTVHAAGVAWANAFWTSPGYETIAAPEVTFTNVTTVQVVDATGLQTFRRDSSLALSGSNISGNLPADIAIVTSLRTAESNRRGRGRFYLPQPAKDNVDSATGRLAGVPIGTILDALATAFGGYVATATPVIYSRTDRATRTVTSFDIGDLADTQRRRESSMLETRDTRNMP